MSLVHEEFGPTLPELLGPRVRALSRAGQVALAALAALVLAAVVAILLRDNGQAFPTVVVRQPIAYHLNPPPDLRRVAPRGRETLRLESAAGAPNRETIAISPLRLPAYRGDSTAVLTGMSPNLIEAMRRTMPGFAWRGDGRTSINRQPGYEILFQTVIGGRTWYGRRMLIMPNRPAAPREGVDIMLMSPRSARIPRVDSIARVSTPLKTAVRSFWFGTDGP